MNKAYIAELAGDVKKIAAILKTKGVHDRHLKFGGEGEAVGTIRVPTDARSEFLANRAMGDWAEQKLAAAINQSAKIKAVQYGETDATAAGEDGFADSYRARVEAVRKWGKRPDLLIFEAQAKVPTDLSGLPIAESDKHVGDALSAIEVRSSKFDALTYMKVRAEDRANGKKGRDTPSFTVKVEDLRIVYRWIERYGISQSYFQVFFDSVFAINFKTIFRLIALNRGIVIENPAKSQEKATILIPITQGAQVGKFTDKPEFVAEHRVTRLGRHDAFVRPTGGTLVLDQSKLLEVLGL